jgi:hypothetical protein
MPATQDGQARSLFNGVRSHADDTIVVEGAGFISSPRYGQIKIFHAYSDYYRQKLHAFIVVDGFDAQVTMTNVDNNELELEKYRGDFEQVVRSVIIDKR